MPYKLFKIDGGYKVGLVSGGKMSTGKRFLSIKPLTKKQGKKQLPAVRNSKNKKKKKKKS